MNARSATPGSASAMQGRLAEVLQRIDKELARSDSPNDSAGTAYVGGIAKLGANLDAYLLEVWRWVNARMGRDSAEVARRTKPPILLDRATAGQLLFLLSTLVANPVAREPEVRWVFEEARDRSALHNVLELRNAIVHGRAAPDASAIRDALSKLRTAFAPQLESLRGSP